MSLPHDLLTLQRADTRLDQLRHRRVSLAERADVKALDESLASLRADLDKLRSRQTDLSRSQRRLEDEVSSIEQKRADVERKMSAGTVPRELQALVEEGDALRRRQSSLEDELLEIMELSEPVTEQVDDLDARAGDLTTRLADATQRLAAAEGEIDRDIAAATTDREAAVAAVPATNLAEYERLRARLDGIAVSELVGTQCTGCHTTLAAMEVERIRREPPDAIVYCEPCGRIVVRT